MGTSTSDVVAAALAAAVRAPSAYNTQPWRFVTDDGTVDVLLDRARLLAVADPDAHEARLACGAALANMQLSLRAAGLRAAVELKADQDDAELLATVHVGSSYRPTPQESQLAAQIPRRRTNRQPFLDRGVEPPKRHQLIAAARHLGTELDLVDAGSRYTRIADLIRRADRVQTDDPAYQAEFRQWTGGPADRPDGVPLDTIGPAPDPDRVVALRTYYRPEPIPARPYEQQPLLGAVLTHGSGRSADVLAGMAMQRVLLTASLLGLSCSFLSQPFEVPATRDELTALFAPQGQIHVLLRMGYGLPVPRSPRIAVDDVTTRNDRGAIR